MPYSAGSVPDKVKGLPSKAQSIWIAAFNAAYKDKKPEADCNMIAWGAVKNAGFKEVNGKWSLSEGSCYYIIQLAEDTSKSIEIMRVGNWKHPLYGDFKITEQELDGFIRSFNENVRGIEIAIDLEHGETSHAGAAVGWIRSMCKQNGSLLAEIEWTELGTQKVASGEYKYFSPEFKFNYQDTETGMNYQNVLLGGSLTNRPFIKNMAPVLLSEKVQLEVLNNISTTYQIDKPNKEEEKMNKKLLDVLKLEETVTEEDVLAAIDKAIADGVKLAEIQATLTTKETELVNKETELVKLNEQIATLTASKTTAEQESIKLAERVKSIETILVESEWTALSTKLLSEGKLTPAMAEVYKTAYMKDKVGTRVLMEALQPVVKLGEQGSSKGNGELSNIILFDNEIKKIMDSDKVEYAKACVLAEVRNPELFQLFDAERSGR